MTFKALTESSWAITLIWLGGGQLSVWCDSNSCSLRIFWKSRAWIWYVFCVGFLLIQTGSGAIGLVLLKSRVARKLSQVHFYLGLSLAPFFFFFWQCFFLSFACWPARVRSRERGLVKVSDGWAQVLEEVRAVMLAWCGKSRCRWRRSCWRWGLLPAIQAAANPPCCGVELVWKCRFSLAESRPFSEPCCSWSSVGVSSGRDRRCENTKKSGQCLTPQTVGLGGQAQAEWIALHAHGAHFSKRECERADGGNGKGAQRRISNTMGRIWERVFLVPLKM